MADTGTGVNFNLSNDSLGIGAAGQQFFNDLFGVTNKQTSASLTAQQNLIQSQENIATINAANTKQLYSYIGWGVGGLIVIGLIVVTFKYDLLSKIK